MVKIIYRQQEFLVRPGMALIDALKKINILPESIIATRAGEMITEDELLNDGDEVILVAVISGG
jgi:sulfur carrier protein ThiS